MLVIDRKAPWIRELAWLVALLAELGHEQAFIAITREYLHSIVVGIGNEQETSMMVERHASRPREHAISIAIFLGANRELDSSIAIKSTVSHLFQSINISRSLTDRHRDDARDAKVRSKEQYPRRPAPPTSYTLFRPVVRDLVGIR